MVGSGLGYGQDKRVLILSAESGKSPQVAPINEQVETTQQEQI